MIAPWSSECSSRCSSLGMASPSMAADAPLWDRFASAERR
jgi:hypothetical protein